MTRLSIVVAIKAANENLEAILARLAPKLDSETECILVSAGELPDTLETLNTRIVVIVRDRDALIPRLWADGIAAATGDWVATTTAQCVPALDWVDKLRELVRGSHSAVGGSIQNDPHATGLNWAIYYLRYSAFFASAMPGRRDEVAADNAVYNRSAIVRHSDLLASGFWEPSFHARFRNEGRTLFFDPALLVEHRGLITGPDFALARFLHGREFGRTRGEMATLSKRIGLLAMSPLVPVVITWRVLSRVSRAKSGARKLLASAPWLSIFVLAWSAGEALGYAEAITAPFLKANARRTGHVASGGE